MNMILDIGLLCVFLFFILIGIKRGFIRSAVHFLGAVIAAFLASALGGAAAKWVFDTLFREALVSKIGETILSLGGQGAAAAAEETISSLPDFIQRALEEAGITVGSLQGMLASKTGEAAELIADALSPVFVSFLKVLAVIVLFMLFTMLVRVLANLVASVFRLPVLRQLDGLLGGVFGFLLALVAMWILVSAVQVFIPMLAAGARADLEEALDHSLLAGLLIKSNPMGTMFR